MSGDRDNGYHSHYRSGDHGGDRQKDANARHNRSQGIIVASKRTMRSRDNFSVDYLDSFYLIHVDSW